MNEGNHEQTIDLAEGRIEVENVRDDSKKSVDHGEDTNANDANTDDDDEVGSETVSCSSAASNLDFVEDDSEMPLLKYARILGSLPRSNCETSESATIKSDDTQTQNRMGKPLSLRCKCSVMGRVTVTPSKSNESTMGLLSDSSHGGSLGAQRAQEEMMILQSIKTQSFSILAMVTEDESIHLLDPRTGIHICSPNLLVVNHHAGTHKSSIVSLSFDASGNYLAAVTTEGDVAIFELRFGITSNYGESVKSKGGVHERANEGKSQKNTGKRPELKAFDSFLSRLAGDEWTSSIHLDDKGSKPSSNDGLDNDVEYPLPPIPCLKLTHPISTARFSVRSANTKSSKVTCVSIDPAYKRKREKGVLVGFSNGFLVYTRRNGHGGTVADSSNFGGVVGSLLQPKRHDITLYEGSGQGGPTYSGIEAIAWRGSLVSWADLRYVLTVSFFYIHLKTYYKL